MNNYEDLFSQLESMDFGGAFLGIGVFIAIIALIVGVIAIIIYVFQSIALYKLADKNNIANAWLSWIPVGNMYILGKLGFEIYADDDKKNEVFTWILLGCSAASILLDDLSGIASLGVLVFSTWAYYYIFNKINKPNAVLLTVLTAIFRIGGIILFFNRNRFANKEVVKEPKKETKTEEVKNEVKEEIINKPKYCSYCGNKVNKTSKFCSKCGNKL